MKGTGGGNTPVQNLKTSTIIDWLGYSIPPGVDPFPLAKNAPGLPWTLDKRPGRYGYARMWRLLACELWEGDVAGGSHVDLSGRACRDMEEMLSTAAAPFDWQEHLAWITDNEWSVSRLDFSIDILGQGASVMPFAEAIKRGAVKSRFDLDKCVEMKRIMPGAGQGHTVYMGAASSDARLVIYDKRVEQKLGMEEEPWVRVELRTRHETARALTRSIAEGGMQAGLRVLRGYADFKDTRGSTLPIWREAIQGEKAEPLKVHKRGGTIASARRWIHDMAAPTIAMLAELEGGDLEYLERLIAEGRAAQTARHKSIIADARARQSYPTEQSLDKR